VGRGARAGVARTMGKRPESSACFDSGVTMNWQEWSRLADNPSLWENREEKGLIKAEYVDGYTLRLWFEDGLDVSIYELDFTPLMVDGNPGGVFEALKDHKRFQNVRGDYALIWPNPETGVYDEKAIDIAPECVRFFCERYGKLLKPVKQKTAKAA
jgi:hypothetical protein